MRIANQHHVLTNRVNQTYMLETILTLQQNKLGKPVYRLEKQKLAFANKLLKEYGFIRKEIPYSSFVVTY